MTPESKTAARWTQVLAVTALVLRTKSKGTATFCGLPAMAKVQHGLAEPQLAGVSAMIMASLRSYGEPLEPPVMLSTAMRVVVGTVEPMLNQADIVKLRS